MSPTVGTIVRLLIIALDFSKLDKSFAVIFTCNSRMIDYTIAIGTGNCRK